MRLVKGCSLNFNMQMNDTWLLFGGSPVEPRSLHSNRLQVMLTLLVPRTLSNKVVNNI